MTKTSTFKALLASLLLITPAAQAVVMTFDEPALSFQHGTVVDTQYNSGAYGNATISADDFFNTIDLAVAFDSNTPRADTTDDDLLAPFSSPLNNTIGNISPGNILILQENGRGCADGICDDPDDEGGRIAGVISVRFEQAIDLLSLDFFDIESAPGNDENSGQAGTEIKFFDQAGNNILALNGLYNTPGTGGNNTWNRLEFAAINGIYGIDIGLRGSGAIDNLTYNVVPVPAAIWLFGTALIGFIGFSRRTSV